MQTAVGFRKLFWKARGVIKQIVHNKSCYIINDTILSYFPPVVGFIYKDMTVQFEDLYRETILTIKVYGQFHSFSWCLSWRITCRSATLKLTETRGVYILLLNVYLLKTLRYCPRYYGRTYQRDHYNLCVMSYKSNAR